MKISNAYPSKYVSASDLNGRNVSVIIARAEMEKLGNDHKPVLYFRGKEKGLVLNKTNAYAIKDAYGDDTDGWEGKELVLFEIMTDFQGKITPAIRVRTPSAKDRQGQPKPAPVVPADPLEHDPMRDIPF